MTTRLRVALLATNGSAATAQRAQAALRARGHTAVVLRAPSGTAVTRAAARVLRMRGFEERLVHLPWAVRALLARPYDLAHAFTAEDAVAALLWQRRSRRPVVFTPAEPLVRERLADRRLRLRTIEWAVNRSDALAAPSEESREALRRWLAIDGPVVSVDDAAALEELYARAGAAAS